MDTEGTPESTSVLNPDDQDRLLVAAAGGDKDAFSDLFKHFGPRLKAHLVRAGVTQDGADEFILDVMLTVWRRAGEYDPDNASAAAWIFTVVRNHHIDLVRQERRPEIDPGDPALRSASGFPAAGTPVQRARVAARLRSAIKTLPQEQEEALFETFFHFNSYGNPVTGGGLPSGAVKTPLQLALARLKLELKEAL